MAPIQNSVAIQPLNVPTIEVASYQNILSAAVPVTTLYTVARPNVMPSQGQVYLSYLPFLRLTAWYWLTQQSSDGHQIGPLTIMWTDPNGNPQTTSIGYNIADQRSRLHGEGSIFALNINALQDGRSIVAGTAPLVVQPGSAIQFKMAYSSTQNPAAQYALVMMLEAF